LQRIAKEGKNRMTPQEKSTIKAIVLETITNLQTQITQLQEKTKPISPDCSLGRLTRLEAMGESHVNHKVLEASQIRLTRLQNALLRIDTPQFGYCIECDEEIGMGRLKVRPESVRCVICANETS
jgi:DnaK suppressor protein